MPWFLSRSWKTSSDDVKHLDPSCLNPSSPDGAMSHPQLMHDHQTPDDRRRQPRYGPTDGKEHHGDGHDDEQRPLDDANLLAQVSDDAKGDEKQGT
jgi:hypothetical protein